MAYAAGSAVLKLTIDDSAAKTSISDIKKQINSISADVSKLASDFKNIKLSTNAKAELKDSNKLLNTFKQIKTIINSTKNSMSSEAKKAATAAKQRAESEKESEQSLKRQTQELNKQSNTSNNSSNNTPNTPNPPNPPDPNPDPVPDSNLSKLLSGLMKVTSTVSTITVISKVLTDSVKTYYKVLNTTYKVMGNVIKYFAQMTAAASKFVYTFSGTQAVVNGLVSAFGYLKEKIDSAFSIDSVENFLKECTELGSALTEIQNVIDKTFGESASSIDSWSQSLTTSFGLTELNSKEMVGNMGAILESAGMTTDAMETMSKNITLMSADMASFYNDDVEDTFKAMRSAMTGQVRPMLQYGVSTHAATLEQYLLSKGIDASYNSLTYASKELVRYNYLMETLQGRMGDFADTQWTFANQQRTLSMEWQQFKTILGQSLKAVLTPVLIVLRGIVQALTQAAQALYTFVSGWGIWEKLGISLDTTANSVEGVSDLYDDMGDSITEAASKAKKATSSFDELHKLGDDSSSSLSGLTDLTDMMDVFDGYTMPDPEGNPIKQWIDAFIEKIKSAWASGDFTEIGKMLGALITSGLEWLNKHWKSIFSIVENFGTSLASFLNGLIEGTDFSLLGQTLQNTIKTILHGALAFITEFDAGNAGKKIGDFINGLLLPNDTDGESGLSLFAKTFTSGINSLAKMIKNAASVIDGSAIGSEIGNAINIIIENIDYKTIGEAAGGLASKVFQALGTAFKKVKWKELGTGIDELIQNLFKPDESGNTFLDYASEMVVAFVGGVVTALNTALSGKGLKDANSEIHEFFKNLKDNIPWSELGSLVITIKNEVSKIAEEALGAVNWWEVVKVAAQFIGDAIPGGLSLLSSILVTGILGLIYGIGKMIVEAVVGIIKSVIGIITTLLELLWLGICTVFEGAPEWFGNLFESASQAVSDAWSSIGEFFQGVWDSIVEAFNSAVEWFKGLFEGAAQAVTDAWSGITGFFSGIWDGIVEIFSAVGTWFQGIFSSAVEKIKEAWSGVTSFFSGIWEGIKNIFSGVGDWFKGIFEGAFSGIADKWDSLKKRFGIGDDTEISVSTNSPLLKSFSLPKLAQGGYVGANMPQLAVVGDNRTQGEIIAPEGKIFEVVTQAMSAFFGGEFMNALANAMATALQGYGGTGDIVIPLTLDGTELTRIILSQQEIEMSRRG